MSTITLLTRCKFRPALSITRTCGPQMGRSRLFGALATSESFPLHSPLLLLFNYSDKIFRNGYSQHGDYVFGWKDDSLQRAMDARCDGDVCKVLETQTADEAMKCTKSRVVNEEIDGCKSKLPDHSYEGVNGFNDRLTPS